MDQDYYEYDYFERFQEAAYEEWMAEQGYAEYMAEVKRRREAGEPEPEPVPDQELPF